MKRIIIIFIVMACLLSFTEISYLAEERLTFGEYWNALSELERVFFIWGFRSGISLCLEKFEPFISTEEIWIVHYELYELYRYVFLETITFITVITDLYEDPANTHIWHSDMCQIAYQKLMGEDIEPLLREARKKASLQLKEEEEGIKRDDKEIY